MQFQLFTQHCTCTVFSCHWTFIQYVLCNCAQCFIFAPAMPLLWFPYEALFSSCAISSRVYVAQDGISQGCWVIGHMQAQLLQILPDCSAEGLCHLSSHQPCTRTWHDLSSFLMAWHYPSCSYCCLIYLELNAVKVSKKFGKSLFDLMCISEAPYDRRMILWIQGQVSRRLFSVPSTQLVYMPPMISNIAVLCAIVICVFVSREHHMACRLCLFSSPLHALHCFIWGKTQCFLTLVVGVVSKWFFLPIRGHWLQKEGLELGSESHSWPFSFLIGWFNASPSLSYWL